MPKLTTVTVRIPAPLHAYSAGAPEISVTAASVRGALAQIGKDYPALYRSICDETGAVRRHVNVFVNRANVRDAEGLDTELAPGDFVTIMPAVSGGMPAVSGG